jgi:tetratricopeptide (TPR) repeat protein
MLKLALRAFREHEFLSEEEIRWMLLACHSAMDLWDDSWFVLSARPVRLAREAGALTVLPLALSLQAGTHILTGRFAAAEELCEQARAVSDAIGNPDAPYPRLVLAAWRGQKEETVQLTAAGDRDATARGGGRAIGVGVYATAVLCNGLGRYEEALVAAQQAGEDTYASWWRDWGLVELIEAAARSGNHELAAGALRRLSERTRASSTDWAVGVEACSRALISDGEAAELLYRQAVERLARTRIRVELARAHSRAHTLIRLLGRTDPAPSSGWPSDGCWLRT